MSSAAEPRGRYLEDLSEGLVFVSGDRVVDEALILEFARLTGDSNPLHVDRVFAVGAGFPGLVASGNLGLTLALTLFDDLGLFHGTAIAALGIDQWRYLHPLTEGMVVHAQMTLYGIRRSDKDPSRGIVGRAIELLDERGRTLQAGRTALLIRARSTP